MIGRPGSTLWLLRHEVRLSLRAMMASRGRRSGLVWVILVPVLVGLLLGAPLGLFLREHGPPEGPLATLAAALVLAMIFSLMLSRTLATAVEALYERADFDLLFSSPLSARRLLVVRFLGVALSTTVSFAYVLAPPLIPIAALGTPGALGGLGVLLACGLAASGAGLALAIVLFRLLGPRRTRAVGQVAAALIGAGFFLAAQLGNIMGEGPSEGLVGRIAALAGDPTFRLPPGADWPLRAMLGEPLPLAAAVLLGAAVFAASTAWSGQRFAADLAAAGGAAGTVRRKAGRSRAFAGGAFAVTLRKELRLLLRDPALLGQALLRVLYLLPIGFVAVREGRGGEQLLAGAAAGLSIVSAQLAGVLAWITVSAEDAPELIASAPAPRRRVWRAKLAAALLPVLVLLAVPVLPLAVASPWIGASALAGAVAAAVAAALVNLWWQQPGKRSEFNKRRRANLLVTLAEFTLSLLIAAAAGLLAARLAWALAPAAAAALLLLALRRRPAEA